MRTLLHKISLASLCIAHFLLAHQAIGQEFLFSWIIEADDGNGAPENAVAVTNDVRSIGDQMSSQALETLFPGEDFSNPNLVDIDANLNLRGVLIRAAFVDDSSELVISAPFLDSDLLFNGDDRDGSVELFEKWLRGEFQDAAVPDTALTELLQELVAHSAVDPIAGNPNSLQTRMFEAAYFTGSSGVYRPSPNAPGADEWTGKDHFRAQVRYDRFKAGPWSGNVWEIGLDYQINFRHPKFAVLLDLPFTVSQTEGSESFLVSVGLGLQWRPTHWWNLTPSFRLGGAGSFKLGAVAIMANANLTSSMRWEIGASQFSLGGLELGTPDFELNIGNMFGWNGTFDDIVISDIRIAYELNNYAIRNGIDLTRRLNGRWLGGRPVVKLYFTDTWILGSRLFLDHYNELGLQTGTQSQTGGQWRDNLAFSAGWVFGNRYDALQLKLSYRF